MLHCHDGKADCSDVLYIFSVRISVSHAEPDLRKAVVSDFVRTLSAVCPDFVRASTEHLSCYSDFHCLYMGYLSIHYPEPDNCRLIGLFIIEWQVAATV